MKIIQAKSAGFCLGVSLALKSLYKELEAYKSNNNSLIKRLVMWGPIIHNPLVIDKFLEEGVICVEDVEKIEPGDLVVVRAHGIPKDLEQSLKDRGAKLLDATCPKVKKAQLSIAKKTSSGAMLLLFGELTHPEVQGLISYADYGVIVFDSLDSLKEQELSNNKKYVLAAQTTQDQEEFFSICSYLKDELKLSVPVLKTICDATQKRQDEVIKLTKEVDAMVVVGGLNSGNTRRLASIAASYNVNAIHVEKAEDINIESLKKAKTIGLTAGASTPDEHINSVRKLLESL